MPHLKFFDFFRFYILLSGLIFIAAKGIAQDSFKPSGQKDLFKTTVTNPDPHNIFLDSKKTNGFHPISVFKQTQTQDLPGDKMRFFVILPDGNFIYLETSSRTVVSTNPLVTAKTPFKTEIRLQNITNTQPLRIQDMKVWALEKNNPDPPLRPGPQTQPTYRDGGSQQQTGPIPTGGSAGMAYKYLDPNSRIKIGTSWSPWDKVGAYYYLIISYSNKTITKLDTGTIKLSNCLATDPTSFSIQDYTAYNALNNNLWETEKQPPSGLKFGFKDLLPNEIRHIYIRMKRDTTPRSLIAYYKAEISYIVDGTTLSEETDCTEILLKNAPHDPNVKIVDQSACTANGTGTLSYYVSFQNEGNGVAKDVIIIDGLPKALAPYSMQTMGSSYPATLQNTIGKDTITYTFTDINLPGSAQTVPRVYDYNETVGWVKFSCNATCPELGDTIKNNASIVFVTMDTLHLAPIHTESITTVADDTPRDTIWPVTGNSCRPKCCFCILGKRHKWCLWCVYRRHPKKTKH